MPVNRLRQHLVTQRKLKGVLSRGDRPQGRTTIPFGMFVLRKSRLGMCDPSQIPSGVSVECGAGRYELEAECLDYVADARVSRVLAKREGSSAQRGKLLGQIPIDLAMACFFDFDRLEEFARDNPENYEEWIDDDVVMCDWVEAGVLNCRHASTKIPYFEVGFGDGLYNVFELRDGDLIVGLEGLFLEPDSQYPFDRSHVIAAESLNPKSPEKIEVPNLERLAESLRERASNFTGSETVEDLMRMAEELVDDAIPKKPK